MAGIRFSQITASTNDNGEDVVYGLSPLGEVWQYIGVQTAKGKPVQNPGGDWDNSRTGRVGNWTPYWKKLTDAVKPEFEPASGHEDLTPEQLQPPY
jgi:hypothetical protein